MRFSTSGNFFISDNHERSPSPRKPLNRGCLRQDRQQVAETINAIFNEEITVTGKEQKEYKRLAVSFSRLIASYCADSSTGKPIIGISPNMHEVLKIFSKDLQEETELAVKEKLPLPHFSLSKFSIYEIAEVKYKLEEHPDEIVRKNAKTILNTSIRKSDLSLADKLAAAAKPTRDKLAEEYKHDEVVIFNLPTIMSAALPRGNLSLADKLAAGAKSTRDRIAEEYKHDEVVISNLLTIMSAALARGNLSFADELAAGAKSARDRIAEEYKHDEVVISNLPTIMHAALARGNLSFANELAAGAKSTRDKLAEEYKHDEVVISNLRTFLEIFSF